MVMMTQACRFLAPPFSPPTPLSLPSLIPRPYAIPKPLPSLFLSLPRSHKHPHPHPQFLFMATSFPCPIQYSNPSLWFGAVAAVIGAAWIALHMFKSHRNEVKVLSVKKASEESIEGIARDRDGFDVIIVGAGVAGSALAYTLGKDGKKILVVERDMREPDRIVGELLQPGGYLKLIELGLQDCVEDIDAQKVFGYALFKEGRDTRIGYPLEGYEADVAGRSFHNGRFIQNLRNKADSLPTVQILEGNVLSLIEEGNIVKGVRYRRKEKEPESKDEVLEVFAPLTIVCDGCFSNLRHSLCASKPEVPSYFVGLVLENCELPYSNHGHVILADPSPILFYPISSAEVRCLVDIPKKVPSIANGDMTKYLCDVVAPQLPKQLQETFVAAAMKKEKIRVMPNKSMPADPVPRPGALLMGDAFNMRHPLTGGGMTVALSDILVLRNLLQPLQNFHNATSLCSYLEKFYTLRKPVASTINTLAGALYQVFCYSPDLAMKEMRHACFEYLSLGGVFSSGPVALLSGLNPSPISLVAHFFAVAVYGVGRLLIPFPSPEGIWLGFCLIRGASNIIFPIIKAEGVWQMFFPNAVSAYYKTVPKANTRSEI